MENTQAPIQKSPLNVLNPPEFQEIDTISFLTDLYSYPPKFNVSVGETNVNNFNGQLKNKIRPANSLRVLENKLSYKITDYINGFLNKNFTSNFYKIQTKPIQKALKSVPVYIVVNGRDEIVLFHKENLNTKFSRGIWDKSFIASPRRELAKIFYDFCGAFQDNGNTRSSDLGLVFFNYEDAEVFRDDVLKQDTRGSQTVGLTIHCVSLESAYNLLRSPHPGFDLRFVPNLQEVSSLADQTDNARFIFEEKQEVKDAVEQSFGYTQEVVNKSTTSPTIEKTCVQGIPIYLIQTQTTPRNFIWHNFQLAAEKIDTILNTSTFGRFSRDQGSKIKIFRAGANKLQNSDKVSNYVFFSQQQALAFCQQNSRYLIRQNEKSWRLQFDALIRKPTIFVTSLENLLEHWENHLLLETHSQNGGEKISEPSQLFAAKETHFISPSSTKEYFETLNEEEIEGLSTPVTKLVRALKVRRNVFTFSLRYLFSRGGSF